MCACMCVCSLVCIYVLYTCNVCVPECIHVCVHVCASMLECVCVYLSVDMCTTYNSGCGDQYRALNSLDLELQGFTM